MQMMNKYQSLCQEKKLKMLVQSYNPTNLYMLKLGNLLVGSILCGLFDKVENSIFISKVGCID